MINTGEKIGKVESGEPDELSSEQKRALARASMGAAEIASSENSSKEDLSATLSEGGNDVTSIDSGEGAGENTAVPEDVTVESGSESDISVDDEEAAGKDAGEVASIGDYEGIPDYKPVSLESGEGGDYATDEIWRPAVERLNPEMSSKDVDIVMSFAHVWNEYLEPSEREALLKGENIDGFESDGMMLMLNKAHIVSSEGAAGLEGAGDNNEQPGEAENGNDEGASGEAGSENGEDLADYEAVSIDDIVDMKKDIDTEKAIKKLEKEGLTEEQLSEYRSVIKYGKLEKFAPIVNYFKSEEARKVIPESSLIYAIDKSGLGYANALIKTGLVKASDEFSKFIDDSIATVKGKVDFLRSQVSDLPPLEAMTIEEIDKMGRCDETQIVKDRDGKEVPIFEAYDGLLYPHFMTFVDLIHSRCDGDELLYKSIVDYVNGENTLPQDSAEKGMIDTLMKAGLIKKSHDVATGGE
ncbi:hypothetical protein IJV57_03415 [Candidatus Saccharibacteria bacterium]|nr:hypothetical protein [Candidatus Saccharibacteria bacterium]